MNTWKKRLYDGYISTGQAAGNIKKEVKLSIESYPYNQKLIREHLPKNKDLCMADLACGHGALIFCLQQTGFTNVQGVDVSPEQIKLAHDLGVKGAVCRDIASFLKEQHEVFDVIFLMDILEHLEKDEFFELLDQVYGSLKSNGKVIIHVPNAEGLYGMRVRYGDLTHENCFTPRSMEQGLNVCGFHQVQCFEDKPVVHGVKSIIRRVLWDSLTLVPRLLLAAETGVVHHIMSQNMLVTARKR